jgi:hypothetical protein
MSTVSEIASVSSEFDIFAHRPIQSSVLGTIETAYKPIAPADQNDLEFLIPADSDTYIDLDIKLYVRGKLISGTGKDVDVTDHTGVTNNFLHSLFSQCNVLLNDVSVTQASEHYHYRSYLETLLTYGSDAAVSHLSAAYWYLDTGDMQPCDPSAETTTAMTNQGFIARWSKLSASKEIQLFGRLHSDICNTSQYLLPGVSLKIRLTKALSTFYLMTKNVDSKTSFKFLYVQLLVRRVRPNPATLIAHNATLRAGCLARYNLTRVQLKTFTFSAGSKSLSIDNAVLGPIPKRLLFTMVRNTDYIGSLDSNPYKFRHYDIRDFSLIVNGKQVPSDGLSLGMNHEKTSVMGYRTLIEASGIHHSNSGL